MTVAEAPYPTAELSANGMLECSLKNRIQMSHASFSTLRNAKLIFPGVDRGYAGMCILLLQKNLPMLPWSWMRVISAPRVVLMFHIDTLGIRRRTFANNFS